MQPSNNSLLILTMDNHQVTKGLLSLHCRLFKNKPPTTDEDEDASQAGVNKASKGGIIYGDYLQVENTTCNMHQSLYKKKKRKKKKTSTGIWICFQSCVKCFISSQLSARQNSHSPGIAK